MLNNETVKSLVDDLKTKMDITYDDEAFEKKASLYIQESIGYFQRIVVTPLTFEVGTLERSLCLWRSFYAANNALPEFNEFFYQDIEALQRQNFSEALASENQQKGAKK